MTTTIKTKTFEQLIVTIGLLCCISFYLSDNQILWNKKQQSTDHHLVNSQFRLLTLPLSSNECVNCNHRSKRSTYKSPAISSSGLGAVRDSDRFTAFSLLPSAANRSVFICPEKFGYFPDKRDCTKYFVCVFGEPLHESCTGGLYFSAELQTCDWPRNVQCPNEKKNYEKSVFSTVDIGTGDDPFDYDVRTPPNQIGKLNDDDDDDDRDSKPNGINANYNKIIIKTHNSSIVRPIEHYVVDKEIPDYTIVDEQPINLNPSNNNNNNNNRSTVSPSPQPTPSPLTQPISSSFPSPLSDGGRNNIDFEINSQPKISLNRDSTPGIDYLTDGLPLPSPTPVSRPSIIYSVDLNGSTHPEKSPSGSSAESLTRETEIQSNRYQEKHGNKINLEFDPQAPNYAEAIPPVVDSKGGIHFSDGVGGTFGIVDQLPGLLSPSVSDHSVNVFVKPLTTDSDKGNSRYRESRLLKDNVDSGYEYIPVIAPEKFTLRSNPLFKLTHGLGDKMLRSRGRSASRPNEQVTGNLLSAVGSQVKPMDSEIDFNINENVTRTAGISGITINSKEEQSHSNRNENVEKNRPEIMGQLLRKEGNEEFVLVPFAFGDGRRRNRGRVRVVPKIVSKNKLNQVKMMNKNGKMLPGFIEAKTDGSVIVRAKPIIDLPIEMNKYSSPSPSISTPPEQQLNSPHRLGDSVYSVKPTPPQLSSFPNTLSQPLTVPPSNQEVNLMSLPLTNTNSADNSAINVQWNKGKIEITDSYSNGENFIASLLSNDKRIVNLDGNHLNSNNGLSDERLTSPPIRDNNHDSDGSTVKSTTTNGIRTTTSTSTTTSTTTTTTPSPISIEPFVTNTPFVGKIIRTLRPQTVYSEPVKIITENLSSTRKPDKQISSFTRPKVEDELTWPEDGFLPNKEPSNSLTNGRQQSTPRSTPKSYPVDSTSIPTPYQSSISSTPTTTTPSPKSHSAPSPSPTFASSISTDSETTFGPRTRGPVTRKQRPTNKRLVVKQRTTIAPIPPSRPASVYPTPQPLTSATKCDPRKCRLPDCNCGGPAIPGGLTLEETPQIVLLTFDDAVNDLNWELYEEIFNSGRLNPNGCPILGTFYTSHEWTDYGQVQTLYSRGHEFASHTVTHSFGEKFSKSQWHKEVNGQRELLHLYGGVRLEDIRGMRAPFLQIGGNRMFEMLHEDNFTYDSSMPVFDNRPPFWPYTLDYSLNHDCMISPCPTKSFPGVWEVGMVMWEDLKGGRCSMADSCSNPSDEEGVYEMLLKNFNRHYSTNRAPFGLFYHSAWFNTNHHRRGFMKFIDTILSHKNVYLLTNWQLIEWIRNPTPLSTIKSFQPWSCDNLTSERPGPCHHPNVCNVRYQSGTRFMKTCQPCPDRYPWVGGTSNNLN